MIPDTYIPVAPAIAERLKQENQRLRAGLQEIIKAIPYDQQRQENKVFRIACRLVSGESNE